MLYLKQNIAGTWLNGWSQRQPSTIWPNFKCLHRFCFQYSFKHQRFERCKQITNKPKQTLTVQYDYLPIEIEAGAGSPWVIMTLVVELFISEAVLFGNKGTVVLG